MEASAQQNTVDLSLAVATEKDQVAFGSSERILVMASLKAPFFEETHRAPVDVSVVIDRSGSMNEQGKMTLVKETMAYMVKNFKAADRLSITIYDEHIETVLPLSAMNADGKDKALSVVSAIHPRGSTDLCSGLIRGIETIKQRGGDKNSVSSVLIFTDGLANHGVTTTTGILEKMGTDIGCTVHTFGFGKDHDANMLKAISDRGNGVYFFLKDKDDIPEAFADCLGGLLSVVGQNFTLNIEGINGNQITQVHSKFKHTLNNGSASITLGDIQSEEVRDILVSLTTCTLPGSLAQQEVARVTLSYFNVISAHQCDAAANVFVARPEQLHDVNVNFKVDIQRNRITAADSIAEARALGDKNDLKAARAKVEEAIAKLKISLSKSDPFTLGLILDLEKTLEGLQDRSAYTTFGNKTMNAMESAHNQQRSAGKTSSPMYETSSRMQAKAAYKQ